MSLHARPQYRWNGTKIKPNDLRETEAELERLLRLARARSAAAYGVERPALDNWPTAADAFVWRPDGLGDDHGPRKLKRTKEPRGTWPARSLPWLLLMAMPGIFGVLFAPDLMSLISLIR